MTKLAIVDPKVRMAAAEAGSEGGGLMRCLPPTPRATRKTTRTGIQAIFSYLGWGWLIFNIRDVGWEDGIPIQDVKPTEGDLQRRPCVRKRVGV